MKDDIGTLRLELDIAILEAGRLDAYGETSTTFNERMDHDRNDFMALSDLLDDVNRFIDKQGEQNANV